MENFAKYLCIFGGGAVRGYSYLGVLQAFEKLNFYPQKLAGSSVGAVIATFSALNMSIKDMQELFLSVNFELFKDINFTFGPAISISKGNVFLQWLRMNIEKAFYKENYKKGKNQPVAFKDLDRDLIIITTDLTTFEPFIFSKETTPDYEIAMAIRASAALPGLITPVEFEDKILADGDLVKSKPMWLLDKVLYPEDLRILDLRLEGLKQDKKIKNVIDFANTVYSCVTNISTDFIMKEYSSYDKFNFIKIDTKDLILVDFNIGDGIKDKLIDIGYISTLRFFKEELPKKKKCLLEKYTMLRDKLYEVEKHLSSVKKAKMMFADLLSMLLDVQKNIDRKIFKQIKEIKNSFYQNIAYGFLGKEILKNKNEIKAQIMRTKELLDEKCIELSL